MAEINHYWCQIPHDFVLDSHGRPREFMWPIYLDDKCIFFPIEAKISQEELQAFFRSRATSQFHLLTRLYTLPKTFNPTLFPHGYSSHQIGTHGKYVSGILGLFTSSQDAMICRLAWNPTDLS